MRCETSAVSGIFGWMTFHPWRELRRLKGVRLDWQPSGDELGSVNFATSCITLSDDMTQAERRCTLTHELIHIERGTFPIASTDHEEAIVRDLTARRLIRMDRLIDALLWSQDENELAEELWVDVDTVRARLEGLSDADRRYVELELDRLEERMS